MATETEITAAASTLAVAHAREAKYGGSFAGELAAAVRALIDLVPLPDGWDTGPHPSDVWPEGYAHDGGEA